MEQNPNLINHKGSCHCKALQYEVINYSKDVTVWKCNCSICEMRQNPHIIVPKSHFQLLQGENEMTIYKFGSNIASHIFCKICGISPFYIPRSNPDGYAININCIDKSTIRNITYSEFDGKNWEKCIANSNIKECSQE